MIRIIICLFCVILLRTGLAQELMPMTNPEGFKENLNKITASTSTIESQFVQEKNLSVLSEKIITKGNFLFKKENKLRWEYLDPFEYLIVLNGDNVLIKDEERVKRYDMKSNQVFKEINDLMIEMVQGKVVNNDNYKVTYLENNDYFVLDLMPLAENMKAFLSGIQIFLDKEEYSVSKIMMLEHSEDYTSIVFTNQKVNTTISDEMFVIR